MWNSFFAILANPMRLTLPAPEMRGGIHVNPLSWGSRTPEVLVLGFSKGPSQAGALATQPHDQIAYRGGRTNLAKILHHIGLLTAPDSQLVDQAIADSSGRFHF